MLCARLTSGISLFLLFGERDSPKQTDSQPNRRHRELLFLLLRVSQNSIILLRCRRQTDTLNRSQYPLQVICGDCCMTRALKQEFLNDYYCLG